MVTTRAQCGALPTPTTLSLLDCPTWATTRIGRSLRSTSSPSRILAPKSAYASIPSAVSSRATTSRTGHTSASSRVSVERIIPARTTPRRYRRRNTTKPSLRRRGCGRWKSCRLWGDYSRTGRRSTGLRSEMRRSGIVNGRSEGCNVLS